MDDDDPNELMGGVFVPVAICAALWSLVVMAYLAFFG